MNYDLIFINRALELAKLGKFTTSPNPNVGCVIVNNNNIIGEGYHKCVGKPHAEINALNMAGKKARGSTLYVNLEPCNHYGNTPPCVETIINAGIIKVVASMNDPNPKVSGKGFLRLEKAGIEVIHGLMLSESTEINLGFIKRMNTGMP